MLILIVLIFTLSFIFPQGMYVGEIDKPIYSLNVTFNSLNRQTTVHDNLTDSNEKHYGLSLSYVLNGKNELSLGYKENEDSNIINTSYLYYIKPDFYLNMFSGVSYEYIQNSTDNHKDEDKYHARVGVYGNKRNIGKDVKSGLEYFPFFIYDYTLWYTTNTDDCENGLCYYDAITFGCSFLFNDIGIEPSYTWIDKNTNEFSLKIYLWEFGN